MLSWNLNRVNCDVCVGWYTRWSRSSRTTMLASLGKSSVVSKSLELRSVCPVGCWNQTWVQSSSIELLMWYAIFMQFMVHRLRM